MPNATKPTEPSKNFFIAISPLVIWISNPKHSETHGNIYTHNTSSSLCPKCNTPFFNMATASLALFRASRMTFRARDS
jgi:hypothetical protein